MTLSLFNALSSKEKTASSTGRVIFAMDATASRSHAWETVARIQKNMFSAIRDMGELEVQLVYFRGEAECKSSPWLKSQTTMLRMLDKVTCLGGPTQILRVLEHTAKEHDKSRVGALIFIGDSCEEDFYPIQTKAEILGTNRVPIFVFHDEIGAEDAAYSRSADTHRIFKYMAEASNGAYMGLDSRSSKALSFLLQAVAVYATGGKQALADYSRKPGVDETVLRLSAQLK